MHTETDSGSVKRSEFGLDRAYSIYRVVCRLFQLSFCVQLVDHLQRLVVRIHRRLTKPPSWGRLDAKNQVQLDLRKFYYFESVRRCSLETIE